MTKAKITAYVQGIESGKFNNKKQEIYNILKNKHCTLHDLVLKGYPEKTASARISDLMDLGLVKAVGSELSFFSIVTDKKEQDKLRYARQEEKYQQWLKKGEENCWFEKRILEDKLLF